MGRDWVSTWKYGKENYGESTVWRKLNPKGMFALVRRTSFCETDRIKRWHGLRKEKAGE